MVQVKNPLKKKPGSLMVRQQLKEKADGRARSREDFLDQQEWEKEHNYSGFLLEAHALLIRDGQPFCTSKNNQYIYVLIADSSSVNQDNLLRKVVARGFDPKDEKNDELVAKWASVHYPYDRDNFVNALNEGGVSFADGRHAKVIDGIFFGTDFEGSKPCYSGRFNKVLLSLKRCGFNLSDDNNAELIGRVVKQCPSDISDDLKETLDKFGYIPSLKVQKLQLQQTQQTLFENFEV